MDVWAGEGSGVWGKQREGDVQASLWPCLRLLPRARPAPQGTSCTLTAPRPGLVTPGLPRGLYFSLCDVYHIMLLAPC